MTRAAETPEDSHARAIARAIAAGGLAAESLAGRTLASLINRLESPLSAEVYGADLAEFLAWCRRQAPPLRPLSCGREHGAAYGAWLRNRRVERRPLAPDTRRRKLAAVRAFYAEAAEAGRFDGPNPIGRVRISEQPAPAEPALSADEATRLLEGLATEIATVEPRRALRARRDHLAITLLVWRGLRSASLRGLRFRDIVTRDGEPLIQVSAKGGRQLELELTADLVDLIDAWRSACREEGVELAGDDPVLFGLDPAGRPRRREGRIVPMDRSTLYRLVHPALAAIGRGGRRSGPHALRLTSGTLIWEATSDPYLAKEHLGHADVGTTISHYIRPAERRSTRTLARLPLPRPGGPTRSRRTAPGDRENPRS